MQDNEFFVRCNLSSTIFNPEIKVNGKWEVAAYDLAFVNVIIPFLCCSNPI